MTTTEPVGDAVAHVRAVLEQVVDPEIPVLTIADIGILRDIAFEGDTVVVTITPTYSGCPAMDLIRDEVRAALGAAGYPDAEVRTAYSPAWTTDWMSDEAKRKLTEFGIAPPHEAAMTVRPEVVCPQCRSEKTHVVSEFGSTACKALLVCDSCGEPFDYFKEI
jgi:ring-1,2-phenylacetyl-CoA epoxidase subunit PaaD